ncbi:hypothetical protein K458DRAFT_382065 [Lentithecium fluviatile CBS 122367]|uniref:Uncharacterized protein n=1 Tax=Lentithecium fluviatile CBS 122367 TaxID=1168545 RepID=A0A6G1JP21_9PLEO|nr:hypothetical protein K458DRAFT_382065 [Lentithecium fluviatile CBS 122367]
MRRDKVREAFAPRAFGFVGRVLTKRARRGRGDPEVKAPSPFNTAVKLPPFVPPQLFQDVRLQHRLHCCWSSHLENSEPEHVVGEELLAGEATPARELSVAPPVAPAYTPLHARSPNGLIPYDNLSLAVQQAPRSWIFNTKEGDSWHAKTMTLKKACLGCADRHGSETDTVCSYCVNIRHFYIHQTYGVSIMYPLCSTDRSTATINQRAHWVLPSREKRKSNAESDTQVKRRKRSAEAS